MTKQTRIPQAHLIALEPRMMFDGAAVATAATTVSTVDVLESTPLAPGITFNDNNNLSDAAVPNIGLAPLAVAVRDFGNPYAGRADLATVNVSLADDPGAFSAGFVSASDDSDNRAVVMLDGETPVQLEAISFAEADRSAPAICREAQASLMAPVHDDPAAVPIYPVYPAADVSSTVVRQGSDCCAKEAQGAAPFKNAEISDSLAGTGAGGGLYPDALRPERVTYDIRESGVRPADFRDYFIIDDNDSRSAVRPMFFGFESFVAENDPVEPGAATTGQDYIFIDTNVENYQELAETWAGKGIIVFIDGNSDGVDQIMTALGGC